MLLLASRDLLKRVFRQHPSSPVVRLGQASLQYSPSSLKDLLRSMVARLWCRTSRWPLSGLLLVGREPLPAYHFSSCAAALQGGRREF